MVTRRSTGWRPRRMLGLVERGPYCRDEHLPMPEQFDALDESGVHSDGRRPSRRSTSLTLGRVALGASGDHKLRRRCGPMSTAEMDPT